MSSRLAVVVWLTIAGNLFAFSDNSSDFTGSLPYHHYSHNFESKETLVQCVCIDQHGMIYLAGGDYIARTDGVEWELITGRASQLVFDGKQTLYGIEGAQICRWKIDNHLNVDYKILHDVSIDGGSATECVDISVAGDSIFVMTSNQRLIQLCIENEDEVVVHQGLFSLPPNLTLQRIRDVAGAPLLLFRNQVTGQSQFAWLTTEDQILLLPELTHAESGQRFREDVIDVVSTNRSGSELLIHCPHSLWRCDIEKMSVQKIDLTIPNHSNSVSKDSQQLRFDEVLQLSDNRFVTSIRDGDILFFDDSGEISQSIRSHEARHRKTGLVADSIGRLWVPTAEGAIAFDYLSSAWIWQTNSPHTIQSITEFKDQLILGTHSGLFSARISPLSGMPQEEFRRVKNRNIHVNAATLACGKILLASKDGVFAVDDSDMQFRETIYECPPDAQCKGILYDNANKLLFMTGDKLGCIVLEHTEDSTRSRRILNSNTDTSPPVIDDNGRIWFTASSPGGSRSVIQYDPRQDSVRSFKTPGNGQLWASETSIHIGFQHKFHDHRNSFIRDSSMAQMKFGRFAASEMSLLAFLVSESGSVVVTSPTLSAVRFDPRVQLPVAEVLFDGRTSDLSKAICQSRHGHLWIGNGSKLVSISESKSTQRLEAPTVIVRSISVMKSDGSSKAIPLPVNQQQTSTNVILDKPRGTLSIRFTSPSTVHPDHVLYRTRISTNSGGKWTPFSSERSCELPRLDAGAYQVDVQAMLSTGAVSDVVEISLTVRPPLYQQAWVYLTAGGCFVVVSYILFGWRVRVFKKRVAVLQNEIQKRKEAEQMLRESQEQLSKRQQIKALGEMAAGVAHDINNALVPALMYSTLVQENPAATDEILQYSAAIVRSTEDAAEIIRRINPLYQFQATPRKPHDLSSIVDDVVCDCSHRISSSGKKIKVTVSTSEATLVCNIAEIREMLTNLVNNAIDAVETEGTIVVAAYESDDSIGIEVRDDGSGMDDETRLSCLKQFFSTKANRGTGLGLAVSAAIVASYGGSIDIESELGQGSVFKIQLPTTKVPNQMTQSLQTTDSKRPSFSILIVDDFSNTRDSLTALLRKWGHDAMAVANATDAILHLEEKPFDVLVTDYDMPGMNGHELCLHTKQEFPDTMQILISGHDFPGMAESCDTFLRKPINPQLLAQAIEAIH